MTDHEALKVQPGEKLKLKNIREVPIDLRNQILTVKRVSKFHRDGVTIYFEENYFAKPDWVEKI